MTTTTPWAHLPNAAHIDRVLASLNSNPDHWDRAWATPAWDAPRNAARNAARDAAWSKAWDAARDAGRDAARGAVWNAARGAVWAESWHALLALCAYDDCAYMLDSDPGELAILAAFGDPKAILLLYACKVFHSLKTNA